MKYFAVITAGLLGLAAAAPASAQDTAPPKPITVSGNVAIVSDYRLRGVSQSDEAFAIQGGITIAHESGFYVGTWMSSLSGWGTFGGCNCELDLIGGFKKPVGDATIDLGLTTYLYPSGFSKTTVFEPFVKLSGTMGPASALIGVAYAPKQEALGNWYSTGAAYVAGTPTKAGDKKDNVYLWTDLGAGIPNTPITAKAHLGYSSGNKGLGPNGTSMAPTGDYLDWLVGADIAIPSTPLTLGIAYIDTDITDKEAAYLQPNFSNTRNGDSIADGKVVVTLTAAF